MFHVKHLLKAKKPYISVRLFARGLDKEMGMSGYDRADAQSDI